MPTTKLITRSRLKAYLDATIIDYRNHVVDFATDR